MERPTYSSSLPDVIDSSPGDRSVPGAHSELYFAAGPALGLGSLPGAAPGVLVSAGFLRAHWLASVRLGYTPPAGTAPLPAAAGASARIGLATLGLDAGARFRFSALELVTGVGAESGFFHSQARDAADSGGAAAWLAGSVVAGVRVPVGGAFAVGVFAQGSLAILRPQFVLRSEDGSAEDVTAFRPEPLTGRLFAQLEVRLP